MNRSEIQPAEENRGEDRILGYKTSRVLSREELEQISGGCPNCGTAWREDEMHE